ncbi:glucose 1-dehydrogenase [Luteibacter sp. 329MFSha]|uniref:SDR family NAD(P)-dependent oxidoreductase n=1 Tax=Luteibacter sp. 329MFSha TaxID=1798239 RepID=UPI0008C264D3|nr:glucose 1-dehydrogenase [Luteibacter sp. 329MFSha]SEV89676.1 3-oxoacyl-[acyl-carrier protein] reductase [Luteibacter sp. 329MFSha]
MSKLKDKVVLVTGASKGIGAGIARAMAEEGAAVAVHYGSSASDAKRVVDDIVAAGGRAQAFQADMSRPDEVRKLFAEARAALGTIDVLVNNAGIYEFAALDDITEQHFRRHFDLNTLGPLIAMQEAARQFPASGGSIINVSTIGTVSPTPTASVYSASKGALDTLTRVFAKELGPRQIRVNAINPGPTATEGLSAAGIRGSDFEKVMIDSTALGRIGTPRDIAKVAVFLASDDAGWLTGNIVIAAGGMT